jgi:hypothetical protein
LFTGGLAVAVILITLDLPTPENASLSIGTKLRKLDPLGTILFMPSIICLLLGLQWGGKSYPWSSARIIVLFVLFGVLLLAFIAVQIYKQDSATLPPRIMKNRSIVAGLWCTMCIGGCIISLTYFLPIWFQAIKSASAVHSGIMLIPMVFSLVVASMLAAFGTTKGGYYAPFLIIGPILMAVGAGLLSTLKANSNHQHWIGYQVIFGLGLGSCMQQANLAAQAILPRADVPIGMSLMFFGQQLGGTIFVSVMENVFTHKLVSGLSGVAGLDAKTIVDIGATELRNVVPQEDLNLVLRIYNEALTKSFYVIIMLTCLTEVGSLSIEWKNIKTISQDGLGNPSPKDEEKV